jgi:hypothetical protein
MSIRFQLAFLLTFVSVLAILLTLSHLVQAKLASAGYPLGELILLGLPRNQSRNTSEPYYSFTDPVPFLLDMASKFDLNTFVAQNQTVLASVLGAALLTAAFFAFGRKCMFYKVTNPCPNHAFSGTACTSAASSRIGPEGVERVCTHRERARLAQHRHVSEAAGSLSSSCSPVQQLQLWFRPSGGRAGLAAW